METFLLATKLRIPPQTQHEVRRVRLLDALQEAVPRHKLTLVTAPAGYGKTTLLSQWAHESGMPTAWLSISPEDNDLERFFRYLVAAWEEAQPGISESPLGVLLGGMMPDMQVVLGEFVNAASEAPYHVAFVLDDYHLIEDEAIHRALAFLTDHLPPRAHFVLAARAEPPLPLARYRARREVAELHVDDLQFRQDEAADFLNDAMGLQVARDDVASLQERLEGWAAGLQMVALTLRRGLTAADKVTVSGRHRFISDYLSENVLADLPEGMRRFLLRTGILDRLSGPLCDAVTGEEGSQEVLEALERENLFVVPLDDSREWFRYHLLFADFLREQLQRRHPDEVADLHSRAARWYLEHELPDQALHHAVEANDAGIGVEVFDRYTNVKLNSGELGTIRRWLDLIPAQWHTDYPVIGLARGALYAFSGALHECIRCVDEVEQRLSPPVSVQAQTQLAKVSAVRCAIACMMHDVAQAETHAGRAFHELQGRDDPYVRLVYGALGDAYRSSGRWGEAKQMYHKVLDLPEGPSSLIHSVHVYGALADLELLQGRIRDAAAYWGKALAGIQDRATWGGLPLPLIGWVYIRMGEILYEWNELATASDHLSRGLERAELGDDIRAMIAGYLLGVQIKLAARDVGAAVEYLEKARPLVEGAEFPDWAARFERLQLEVWLAQDKLRAADSWAEEKLSAEPGGEGAEDEVRRLAGARALIASGDLAAVDRALRLVEGAMRAAEAAGRDGVVVEALALQALGRWKRGDHAGAMTSLERALRAAEPEGYVRLFVDLGLPMARLLQEARARDVMPDYVSTLLGEFVDAPALPGRGEAALPEPLSQREEEVLALLAAGLTNREIAERLVISAETAKKHVGNICDKLGVRNRTEAAARARELGLLK
ncbi:MAG TPA: LuxR C-terminal-related transcriptional regulator [Chloroflexia bacterium]|nr:LuxR C-terminal-related transcriptional regulator [Chloroflexia bacterium]